MTKRKSINFGKSYFLLGCFIIYEEWCHDAGKREIYWWVGGGGSYPGKEGMKVEIYRRVEKEG